MASPTYLVWFWHVTYSSRLIICYPSSLYCGRDMLLYQSSECFDLFIYFCIGIYCYVVAIGQCHALCKVTMRYNLLAWLRPSWFRWCTMYLHRRRVYSCVNYVGVGLWCCPLSMENPVPCDVSPIVPKGRFWLSVVFYVRLWKLWLCYMYLFNSDEFWFSIMFSSTDGEIMILYSIWLWWWRLQSLRSVSWFVHLGYCEYNLSCQL